MLDLIGRLSSLHRPRLLIRAARIGAGTYDRVRHLPRLLGSGGLPKPATALMQLIEQEQQLNKERTNNDPGYLLMRHVGVLIAIMGEEQLLSDNHLCPNKKRTATKTGSRPFLTSQTET